MGINKPGYGSTVALLAATLAVPAGTGAQLRVGPVETPPQLIGQVVPAKVGATVYIVKLKAPGAASYGGRLGISPGGSRRFDSRSAAVESYVSHVEQNHDRLLAAVGAPAAKLYSLRYALNGFAAELTPAQASQLAQLPEVERVWRDTEQQVETNNSAIFLGLEDPRVGLRANLGLYGENIVIGVIDSGVAPNHPSLLDYEALIPRGCLSDWARGSWLGRWLCHSIRQNPPTRDLYEPPVGFRGTCQTGPGFPIEACNDKVIGARFYYDGFQRQYDLDPGEMLSPRDADGHGTHIATTIAGNAVAAYLHGTRLARVSGLAPRARIAVYKACWLKPGEVRASCATSDLARAIDDAVADGVDIINYSLGSLETDLSAPDDLALLNALDAGVLTVVAAGNDGPRLDTIGSPSSAPWVLTVTASTQTAQIYDDAIEITEPPDEAGIILMREAGFTPALTQEPVEGALILADDADTTVGSGTTGSTRDACQPLANAADVEGQIVLIQRGGCEFVVKLEHAEEAGAIGAVVYNDDGAAIVMNGDFGTVGIPAVMISTADGEQLADAIAAGGDEIRVVLRRGIFGTIAENGNVVGNFASRGPALSDQNFLKPDVTAPGIDILAGHTPHVANGVKGETYQYLSGTSQAAPEAAALAALIKERNPDWSPAMIKSALMTSSYQDVILEDGSDAGPFDMGAGHVNANAAVNPGLVYDNGFRDHAAYLCRQHDPPFSEADCAAFAAAGFTGQATDLNLPSIAVAELVTGDTVRRRVTNVGPPATFTAEVIEPLDVAVTVQPGTIVLATGQSYEFTLTFQDLGGPLDLWDFGRLTWVNGTQRIVSPIAVQPVALRAPAEIHLKGTSGTTSLPVAFNYEGEYYTAVHGLRAAFVDAATGTVPRGFVDDDPDNRFTFRFANGVKAHAIDIPPDQLMARVALFDEHTDGNDDLDLYLYYCPANQCTQVAQSGEFTSQERIDLPRPQPGRYLALVHGFETDQIAGGPGANYSLFAWSVGRDDQVGNLTIAAPATVSQGERLELPAGWTGLADGNLYLGVIEHETALGVYTTTIVNVIADDGT